MSSKVRNLWVKALEGDAAAYRKLGQLFWLENKDKKLSKLCLEKAMELGDELSFVFYHLNFSKGKKVIDDSSYADIYRESLSCKDEKKKNILKGYLQLGTKTQKKNLHHIG